MKREPVREKRKKPRKKHSSIEATESGWDNFLHSVIFSGFLLLFKEKKMYLSLIITFLLLLVIIIASIQNTMPLELKFFVWKLQMSLTALVFYSSVVGAAIVAVLSLPKLVSKHLKVRSLNKETIGLKKEIAELKKQSENNYEEK